MRQSNIEIQAITDTNACWWAWQVKAQQAHRSRSAAAESPPVLPACLRRGGCSFSLRPVPSDPAKEEASKQHGDRPAPSSTVVVAGPDGGCVRALLPLPRLPHLLHPGASVNQFFLWISISSHSIFGRNVQIENSSTCFNLFFSSNIY